MARAPALALAVLVVAGCGEKQRSSSAQFGPTQQVGDRKAADVRFESRGAMLSGTLDLPAGEGPHPTLVWVHGSGEETRDLVSSHFAQLLDRRYAFFAYDKRGAGESEGMCCPLDFDLLADDVLAAVDALGEHDQVDHDAVGLMAISQGGWIAPLAASRSDAIEFAVILSGSAVSLGEEDEYSQLTGDDACIAPPNPPERISELMRKEQPSRFDPRPVLARLEIPVLWLYGSLDKSQPVEKDITVLEPLKEDGKEFTVVVFPKANHQLRASETGNCADGPGGALVDGLAETINGWLDEHAA